MFSSLQQSLSGLELELKDNDLYQDTIDEFSELNSTLNNLSKRVNSLQSIKKILELYNCTNNVSGLFSLLASEIIINICLYLPAKDLMMLAMTNKSLNCICKDKFLWFKLVNQQEFTVTIPRWAWDKITDHPVNIYQKRAKVLQNWSNKISNCKTFRDHTNQVSAIKLNNGIMISVGFDKKINVYVVNKNWKLHKVKSNTNHTDRILCVDLNSTQFVTGSRDESVKLWDLQTLTNLHTFSDHTDNVWSVQFYENCIFSGGSDKRVNVYDIRTKALIHTINNLHERGISMIKVQDNKIYTSSADGTIKIVDIRTYNTLTHLNHNSKELYGFDILDNTLVAGGNDVLLYYDLQTGQLKHSLTDYGLIYGIKIFKHKIITVGDSDRNHKYIKILNHDLTKSKYTTFDNTNNNVMHSNTVRGIWSDEYSMITCSGDNTVKVWDFGTF